MGCDIKKMSHRIIFLLLTVFGLYVSAQVRTYKCDFEGGLCSFLSNDRSNKENWKVGKGKVKAGDTGPSIDHTLGNENGSYLYVDVSMAKMNEVKLQTVDVNADFCVRFFYHMYGADIGDLTVYTQSVYGSEMRNYFFRSNTQGDRWKEALFSITASVYMRYRGYWVTFKTKGKSSFKVLGVIALDDIELTPGKCKDTKRDAFELCTFDDYDCGYTSVRQGSLSWEWSKSRQVSNHAVAPFADHTLGTSFGGYWICSDNGYTSSAVQTTMLSTPIYSKPKQSLNCLHFYIYLDDEGSHWWYGDVKEKYVQVFLKFPNSSQSRKWLITKAKNTTDHKKWFYVEAQANITDQYQLQFVAGLQTPVGAIVALDDIKLVTGDCPEAVIDSSTPSSTSTEKITATNEPIVTSSVPPPSSTVKIITVSEPDSSPSVPPPSSTKKITTVSEPYSSSSVPPPSSTVKITTVSEPDPSSSESRYTSTKEISTVSEPVQFSSESPYTRTMEISTVSEPVTSFSETTSASTAEITTISEPVTVMCRSNKDCLNGGFCKYEGRGSFCKCRYPFKGDNCEINEICESLNVTCNAIGAVCTYFEWLKKGFCECPPTKPYSRKLKMCQDICQPSSCIHGKCEVEDYQQKCRCEEGYEGIRCEKKIQPELVSDNTEFVIAFGILCAACPLISTVTLIIYFRRFKKVKQ